MKFLYLCLCIITLSEGSGFAQQKWERDTIFPGKSYKTFVIGIDDSASISKKIEIKKITAFNNQTRIHNTKDTCILDEIQLKAKGITFIFYTKNGKCEFLDKIEIFKRSDLVLERFSDIFYTKQRMRFSFPRLTAVMKAKKGIIERYDDDGFSIEINHRFHIIKISIYSRKKHID